MSRMKNKKNNSSKAVYSCPPSESSQEKVFDALYGQEIIFHSHNYFKNDQEPVLFILKNKKNNSSKINYRTSSI